MKNIRNKIVIGITILGLISLVYLVMRKFSAITGTVCLIRGIIGIPCPSCGMTRAMKEFFDGNIIAAFRFHPAFWLPFMSTLLVCLNKKSLKRVLIISIVLLVCMYLFRMKVYFPNIEPMNINEKSIFNQFRVRS